MTPTIDIVQRPGTRGYIVRATPDGTGRSASGRPQMTRPWEYGPFSTLWGARRHARQLARDYRDADLPDITVETVVGDGERTQRGAGRKFAAISETAPQSRKKHTRGNR